MGRLRKFARHLVRGFVANAYVNGRRHYGGGDYPALKYADLYGPDEVYGSGAYVVRKRRRRRRKVRRGKKVSIAEVPVEVPASVPASGRQSYARAVVASGLKKGGWLARRLALGFMVAGAAGAGGYMGRRYMQQKFPPRRMVDVRYEPLQDIDYLREMAE